GFSFFGAKYSGGVLASDPTQGINGPRQIWSSEPSYSNLDYKVILPLITPLNYTWDSVALVPYINHIGAAPSDYWYITYDNPQSIQTKVQYVIASNLGGWIIWALDEDYLPGVPHPHPLLDAVQAGGAPAILGASALSSGTVGTLYNASLGATGAAPLQWSLSGGSLPRGLSLNSAGVISGAPTTAGTSSFVVTVENFAGVSSQSFTITIAASAN
ncbi:MAG: putative Ig domain-containing protein, partial [Candidatus Solibacter sp.]